MNRFRSRALSLRGASTSAETRLWSALRNRSLDRWKFRRQHPIDRFVVDFVSLAGKLIVEVDGATHGGTVEAVLDRERTKVLELLGFRVIRVGNRDVYDNLSGVLEAIRRELRAEP